MDVHRVLDHHAVLKHLDLLSDTGNRKVVAVSVKLNTKREVRGQTQDEQRGQRSNPKLIQRDERSLRRLPGDDAGAVVEVACVGQGGEGADRVVAGELRKALHEVVQLAQAPPLVYTPNHCFV